MVALFSVHLHDKSVNHLNVMELIEAIKIRHSVRNFTDEPVAQEIIDGLKSLAEQYNQAAGLHIQIVTDDPEAFTKGMAHYGKFSGVRNYSERKWP